VFSVEKVDEWLQQGLDVFTAVVAELDEEMKQPQHLQPTDNSIDVKTSLRFFMLVTLFTFLTFFILSTFFI